MSECLVAASVEVWALASDFAQWLPARTSRRNARANVAAPTADHSRIVLLYLVLGLQFLSALFFVGDLWTEVLGLRSQPIPWVWQEYIQTFASLGLVIGVAVSGLFLRQSLARLASLNRQIDVASGKFHGHLMQLFVEWELSPSEQSVAICAMKGFSNAEIADLRGTSASTIKSQMNAIYRKCGLGNRQQLISFLVEELLAGVAVEQDG
jgi:DNA-binding CsgD family transcriptional regulator